MRWQGRRRSSQVEDRRGARVPGGRLAVGGCGTLIVVLLVAWLTGTDPLALLQQVEQAGGTGVGLDTTAPAGPPGPSDPEQDRLAEFASVVLADTEETWSGIFAVQQLRYELPTLVLFNGAVRSACGLSSAAVGPFYCPGDARLYLDLSFFADLDRRFGAPGDFAQAYVVAHEVGHHVQNLLGIAERVGAAQQRARSREEANALSVRMELQADCLAGVWGHTAAGRGLLEPGDAEEGLRAAAAIGDDRLQRAAQGTTAPESWTHGSSEMRVQWLRRGLETGDPDACDTFAGVRL
jgi:predicted metalloprotease